MGVDADMRRILENLWLTRIFEAEFGFSDVQSNYSRTYAWMANQLGHMTLGMATVFFFIWIADTITSFADLFVGCKCWPGISMSAAEAETLSSLQVLMYYLNQLLLIAVALLLIGATLVLLVKGGKAKHPEVSDKERSFYVPLPPTVSRMGNWIVLALLVLGLGVIIRSMAFKDNPLQEPQIYLDWLGIVFAIAIVAAAILKLCREKYHFIFAMVSVFGAL